MLEFVNESQGLRAWLQAIDFEFIQDSRTHGLLFLRESQNDWGMKSSSSPFLRAESSCSQGYVQSGSEYLQEWRLWTISEPAVPMFDLAHHKKNCFLMFKRIFLCFHLCLCLLSTGITKKSLTSSFFTPSGIYLGWKDPTKSPFLHTEQS